MGYFSSINSTENITKVVMRVPKNLRTSYYKSFHDTNFNGNNINLISFKRWLANKIHSSLNPIATLIESKIRSKGSGNQGDKSNKLKHDIKNHRLNASSSQSQSGRPHIDDKKLRCWFCRDSHKISDCTVLKATPVDDRRELVEKNKLCFNCLSSNHMISQCQSKYSCKVSGCNKRHHTLLHRETPTKNSVTVTKIDANTQTPNTGNALPNTGSLPPNTANSGTRGASVNNQNAFKNTDNVSTLLQIVTLINENGNKVSKN